MRRSALALVLALGISAPALGQTSWPLIAPTAPNSDNGDRIANTAWVQNFFATGLPLANGKIIIGSAGGIGTPQTMSGDCTLIASGVITCTQAAGNFNVIGNLSVTGTSVFTGGITLGSPTGGNKGAGTLNAAADYYKNGIIIPETVSAPLTLSGAGLLACPACVLVSATAHGDSAYAILSTDRYVYTNAAFTAPRIWTLPAANSLAAGTTIWVQDAQNTVTSTNTLSVARAGADTINIGSTTLLITGAAGGITFTTDGVSNWGVPVQTPSTGGTGRVTLTNHGLLVGAGTNPISPMAVCGTGVLITGVAASDPICGTPGQILGEPSSGNGTLGNIGEYITTGTGNNNANATVTITIAAPAVVTWTAHGFCFSGAGGACGTTTSAATAVKFTTTGALPTGITSGTTVYLKAIDANTFNIATTCANALAGTFITTTGSQSGVQTADIRVNMASATPQDVACITAPAGDWDMGGQMLKGAGVTTTVTYIGGNMATSSAAVDRTFGRRLSFQYSVNTFVPGASEFTVFDFAPVRFPLSANQNFFLVADDTFGTSTMTSSGWLRGRRMR